MHSSARDTHNKIYIVHHVCRTYSLPRQAHTPTPTSLSTCFVPPFILNSSARQLVQKEIADMKEEIKNTWMGSSSAVKNEASTGAGLGSGTSGRPPPLSTRWRDPWVPRKLEFNGYALWRLLIGATRCGVKCEITVLHETQGPCGSVRKCSADTVTDDTRAHVKDVTPETLGVTFARKNVSKCERTQNL